MLLLCRPSSRVIPAQVNPHPFDKFQDMPYIMPLVQLQNPTALADRNRYTVGDLSHRGFPAPLLSTKAIVQHETGAALHRDSGQPTAAWLPSAHSPPPERSSSDGQSRLWPQVKISL